MTQDHENKPVVLIVDDNYRLLHPLTRMIDSRNFQIQYVPDERYALNLLQNKSNSVKTIIIDIKSSGMGGGGFLQQARQIAPQSPILVTGPLNPFLFYHGNFYEFLEYNLKQNINQILQSIVEKTNHCAQKNISINPNKEKYGSIIGKSQSINEIYKMIENLKGSSATVLIQGETGTGKELVAHTIHMTSSRNQSPFVAINCGAIPPNLIESELFGHERGAFTNALNLRKGKFEVANGGTLFLDEIGELDKNLQVKLLRVLQEKEFQRVGGNKTFKTDVRIIAATSRDLKKSVEEGYFRDDLYYRLNVVLINMPPLRERKEDIALLLDHFIYNFSKELNRPIPQLTMDANNALINYTYPGNVRELINIVERMLIICPDEKITLQQLPKEVINKNGNHSKNLDFLRELPEQGIPIHLVEKELILKTLEKTSGNKNAAARMLGITRRLLYLRLSKYSISEA